MRHLREVAVRSATGIYSVPARTYVCDDCLKGSRSTFRTSRGERISSGATVDPTAASSGSTPPPTHTHGPMARAEHAQSICSEAVSFKDHPGRCLAFNRQSGHSPKSPRPRAWPDPTQGRTQAGCALFVARRRGASLSSRRPPMRYNEVRASTACGAAPAEASRRYGRKKR